MNQQISLENAQSNMNKCHAMGFSGVLVSGIVWLINGIVFCLYSDKAAIWSLLVGGTLISPITSILNKLLKLNEHDANNPLKKLALESTIWMIMCIPLAYGLALQKTEWFFQGMLLIIGGRYLTFNTLYGNKIYWLLGASLGIAAFILFKLEIKSFGSLITGSIIELVFGFILFWMYYKNIKRRLTFFI